MVKPSVLDQQGLHLFAAVGALASVSRALADIPDTSCFRGNSIDPNSHEHTESGEELSTSTLRVAQNLAEIIAASRHNAGAMDRMQVAGAEHVHACRSAPIKQHHFKRMLNEELSLIHGQGIWGESVLSARMRADIAISLADYVARSVYSFALAHHLNSQQPSGPPSSTNLPIETHLGTARIFPKCSSLGTAVSSSCHVWPSTAEARQHALRKALAVKYGSAEAAPSAALIAGAPLIMYIRESLQGTSRILTDEYESFAKSHASLREWKEISCGLCVLDIVDVKDVGELRSQVSSTLKNAVKVQRLAPVLVVMDADADTTIYSGAEVLRALCDAYGASLHLEGNATGILAAEPLNMACLQYNPSTCMSCFDSILFDFGALFGFNNLAVVSYFCESRTTSSSASREDRKEKQKDCTLEAFSSDMGAFQECFSESALVGDHWLSRVMALWWLFQRLDMRAAQAILNNAFVQSKYLVDQLSDVPHLIEIRSVGCGANILLSYASEGENTTRQANVNRAIQIRLEELDRVQAFGLRLATRSNRKWILFSPLSALRYRISDNPKPCGASDKLGTFILTTARRCEIAKAGASAFLASVRQIEYFEVVDMGDFDHAPLYFGGVRLVPLGLATKNGLWEQDPEITGKVQNLTCALAAGISMDEACPFESVLFDCWDSAGTSFLCVGPIVETVAPDQALQGNLSNTLHISSKSGAPDFRSIEPSRVDFSIDGARDLARFSANAISDVARTVLCGLHVSSDSAPGSNRDSALGDSCCDLHTQAVDGATSEMHIAPQNTDWNALDDPNVRHETSENEQGISPVNVNPTSVRSASERAAAPSSVVDVQRHMQSPDVAYNLELSNPSCRASTNDDLEFSRDCRIEAHSTPTGGLWELLFGGHGSESDSSAPEEDELVNVPECMDLFRP
jgi:hypothetical protein